MNAPQCKIPANQAKLERAIAVLTALSVGAERDRMFGGFGVEVTVQNGLIDKVGTNSRETLKIS